jgi:hypothetical protein
MLAKDMPLGTRIEVPAERLVLERSHGKKPWRQPYGQLRFTDAVMQASLDAGEAKVITIGDMAVAAI